MSDLILQAMRNYQQLIVWKSGISLVKEIFILSKELPRDERFGLISQMTRAAVSVPANIAEGSSRRSDKDYNRFLEIALGSAFEVETYLIICRELEWLSSEQVAKAESIIVDIIKMLYAFMKKLGYYH